MSEVSAGVGGAFPWDLKTLEGPTLDCIFTNLCSGAGMPSAVDDSLIAEAVSVLYHMEAFKLLYANSSWAKLAMVRRLYFILG